jgi:hypothetical protein
VHRRDLPLECHEFPLSSLALCQHRYEVAETRTRAETQSHLVSLARLEKGSWVVRREVARKDRGPSTSERVDEMKEMMIDDKRKEKS